MSASLVTKFDYEQSLLYPSVKPGKTIGSFFSGVVTQSFPESKSKVGDKVVGFLPIAEGGACAEFVAAPPARLVPVPDGMSPDGAVSTAYAGALALAVLDGRVRPREGDTFLVTAASSAVGVLMVQLAVVVWKAARVVAVVSSPQEASVVNKLGLSQDTVRTVDFHDSKALAESIAVAGGITHVIDLCSLWAGEKRRLQELSCTGIARLLGIQGSWTTLAPSLQVDPPLAEVLSAKNTSVHFVSPRTLLSAPSAQGSILLYAQSALRFLRSETGRSPVKLPVCSVTSSGNALRFILDQFFDGVVIAFA